jgi:hypothetical protein
MKRGSNFFLVTALALAFALMCADIWLARRDARHNHLIENYECGYPGEKPCVGDFAGNGQTTRIRLSPQMDARLELPPLMIEGAPEFVLKIFSMDNTARTHVAVRHENGRARLIIYDGIQVGQEAKPVRVVYAWDGKKLAEIAPAEIDQQILAAMAARDDSGTLSSWIIYFLLKWPLRMVYLLLLFAVGTIYLKRRRGG